MLFSTLCCSVWLLLGGAYYPLLLCSIISYRCSIPSLLCLIPSWCCLVRFAALFFSSLILLSTLHSFVQLLLDAVQHCLFSYLFCIALFDVLFNGFLMMCCQWISPLLFFATLHQCNLSSHSADRKSSDCGLRIIAINTRALLHRVPSWRHTFCSENFRTFKTLKTLYCPNK